MKNPTDIPYHKYQRACQLATHAGFTQAYFKQLQHSRTTIEAFNAINDECLELFGEFKFETHRGFRTHLTNYLKKSK